jgi:cobalamin-dependent methionine synthase I
VGKENLHIGPKIAAIMNKGKYFAIFAVTAGEEFESYLRSSSEANDVLDNYILHAIGNRMVEKAEHLLETKLEEEMRRIPHTQRFSPGYCQWPLSDQGKIVTLLDHPCGIRLTDYYFMIPAKSVSGVIGFGEGVKTDVSECELCELRTVCYKSKFNNQQSTIINNT